LTNEEGELILELEAILKGRVRSLKRRKNKFLSIILSGMDF